MLIMSTIKINPNPAEAADEIVEAVLTLRRLFRAQQYRGLRDGSHDLTHMEAKTLSFVGRNPGATQSALVLQLARDKGQVARLIGGLKERGLLEAQIDEADRRIQRLYLTTEGRGIQMAVQRQRLRVGRLAVTGFDENERRLLIELLHRVRANIEIGD
jgi:DNA-binding MarR family transcriptional regulator